MNSPKHEEYIMPIYKVGGCVRDELLGRKPKDVDYVVVGATEQDMLNMGYDKVGADFPVFIHPQTREEYALARTEKKTGVGYLGFETYFGPEVTLEQDLYRRDFTMNAMAEKNGVIYDPYGGQSDLNHGILRHVNPDAFIEDPVRILRAARFAARYEYKIADETLALIPNVEYDDLVSIPRERITRELEKALKDGRGYKFLKNLNEMSEGIFDIFMKTNFYEQFVFIDQVYQKLGMEGAMCLLAEFGCGGVRFLREYKASSDTMFLYKLIIQRGQRHVFDPQSMLDLINKSDFFRRPEFLYKVESYIDLTKPDLKFIARQMAQITIKDIDPNLKGSMIRDAIEKERKKVFDRLIGL